MEIRILQRQAGRWLALSVTAIGLSFTPLGSTAGETLGEAPASAKANCGNLNQRSCTIFDARYK